MLKYTTSTNIERDVANDIHYITTPNALEVYERIVQGFQSGYHSFNIIGSYGTGKSSFLWALEKNLKNNKAYFAPLNGQFNGIKKFEFLKVIGESSSFARLLKEKIDLKGSDSNAELFRQIEIKAEKLEKEEQILLILVDEFGKFLEYAAKNNPEKELYFIQQLAELANDPNRNIVLITTLHQNFGSYAFGLSKNQKKEWEKVKGRLIDISFDEPIEQLLFLASERIKDLGIQIKDHKLFDRLFQEINKSKLISNAENLDYSLAQKLFPLDYLAANILTQALQRYGQNERSLFTFLSSNHQNGILDFKLSENTTFNISDVFDYLTKNLTSELEDKHSNPHKPQWRVILNALDRADTLNPEDFEDLSKLIKCIGLINLFSKPLGRLDRSFLNVYATLALNIQDPDKLIDKLVEQRIIKFFNHKNKYFFIDGTDVDIEQELLEASGKISTSFDLAERLNYFLEPPVIFAKGVYFEKGAPRFFQLRITNEIETLVPKGEIDGYINLIISDALNKKELIKKSLGSADQLFVLLQHTEAIRQSLFEIEKIDFVIKKFPDDKTAKRLLLEERKFEIDKLEKLLEEGLYSTATNVHWVYNGKSIRMYSKASLNKFLSKVAKAAYLSTPTYNNEMVNREHLSSPILTARKYLLKDLLGNSQMENLGYPDNKFPPQKTIYLSLLKQTGIHRFENGSYILDKPTDKSFFPLWEHSIQFLEEAKAIKTNLATLYESLAKPPFKLKKGFIDFWVPIFLIIKDEDYALFHKEEGYIPYLTSEVLDLIHKKPTNYYIKAYQVEGLKLNLFNKYKEITGFDEANPKIESSLITIFSRFIAFYKRLPKYAQHTGRLSPATKGFRDAIAGAQDPETALLHDIPRGLGYQDLDLKESKEDILNDFIQHLNTSIYEIRTAYEELLDRYEQHILSSLGIGESDFTVYKTLIQKRFKKLKSHLLLAKEKTFFNHIMSKLDDRDSWLKSLGDVILGKGLDKMRDKEEALLMDNTAQTLHDLENLIEIHQLKEERKDDKIVQFQLTKVSGEKRVENIVISAGNEKALKKLEMELSKILKGNKKLGKAALINLLQKI